MPEARIVHIWNFDSSVFMEATPEMAPGDAFKDASAVELLNGVGIAGAANCQCSVPDGPADSKAKNATACLRNCQRMRPFGAANLAPVKTSRPAAG